MIARARDSVARRRTARLYRTRRVNGRYCIRRGDTWHVYDARTKQPTGETLPLMPRI